MVITGNNRNSASPWPNPLLSLSLARSSLLHLHSPFSIQFFLSSFLLSSLLFVLSLLFFLFLSFTHSSLSIRGIYHCPVRLIVLPRSWSVPGRKRLDRLFFFFPSFSFPISSSLPPSLSSINQVKVQFQLGFVSVTFTFFLARTRPGNFPRLPPSRQPLPTIVPPISSCSLSLPPFRRSDTLGISFLYEWIVL